MAHTVRPTRDERMDEYARDAEVNPDRCPRCLWVTPGMRLHHPMCGGRSPYPEIDALAERAERRVAEDLREPCACGDCDGWHWATP